MNLITQVTQLPILFLTIVTKLCYFLTIIQNFKELRLCTFVTYFLDHLEVFYLPLFLELFDVVVRLVLWPIAIRAVYPHLCLKDYIDAGLFHDIVVELWARVDKFSNREPSISKDPIVLCVAQSVQIYPIWRWCLLTHLVMAL